MKFKVVFSAETHSETQNSETDYSNAYTTGNLRLSIEKIAEMFNERITETQKITAQLEDIADHDSENYKQLSDYLTPNPAFACWITAQL